MPIKPISPRTLQAVGALVALVFLLGSLTLALRAPVLGITLTADGAEGLLVKAVGADVRGLVPGERVLSFEGLALRAQHTIEEPDLLPDWAQYRRFMDEMSRLADAMSPGKSVSAALADGRLVPLTAGTRDWYRLPGMFWFQAAVGLLCFLLAYGVWVFRPRDLAARHFAICGLGVMASACCAAVYSTRELVLDGTVFRALSVVNQGSSMLFTSALLMLLWHYPTRLGRRSPGMWAYAATLVQVVAFSLQLTPGPSTIYSIVVALFVLTFVSAYVQWRRTRGRPLERAALKWYLLSIYIGTGLFIAMVMLPSAIGTEPMASQGLMFGVFLIMFVGIALGILRYRLFDLDRWWFGAWSWFLGGLCVLLLDLALVSLFDFSQAGALGLSLALLGWAYFPARQWLWSRMAGRHAAASPLSLGPSLESLASATSDDQLRQRWQQVLQDGFAPLELLLIETDASREVTIAENGLGMRVPDLVDGGALLLRLPQAGGRLFGRDDVARADVLWRMVCHVQGAMRLREQDVQTERGRIMRDLHDDLGGKLLSLVYLGQGEARQIARSAMQDMRDVLSALAASPCGLADAVQEWQAETRQRLGALQRELVWSQDTMPGEAMLSAREFTNLGRILREAVTNSLKHANASRVQVDWRWTAGQLQLRVEDDGADRSNDGAALPVPTQARSIVERVQDLGGTVRWLAGEAGGTVVEVVVPLSTRQAA